MADIKLLGSGDRVWNDRQYDNYFEVEKCQAVASGTLKSIRISASGTIEAKVAIYADNSGSPGSLLAAVNTGTACAAGWNTINISDVSIVKDTYYWLSHIQTGGNTFGVNAYYATGQPVKYKSATYSTFTFPDPAGTGFSADNYFFAHAGWGAEGSVDPEGSLIGGKLIRGGLLLHGVLGR